MTRNGLAVTNEDKAPWQVGRTAVNLAVHEVAETYQHSREAHTHAQPVEYPQPARTELRVTAELVFVEQPCGDDKTYSAAVTAQTAFPDSQKTQWVLDIRITVVELPSEQVPRTAVVMPFVEPAMS